MGIAREEINIKILEYIRTHDMDKLNGKWLGSYSFDPELGQDDKVFNFELTLQVDDEDDISGEIKDISENDQSPGVAKVTGFVDDNEISFIKQYPALFLRNDVGEIIIDKTKEHPEIHYHGVISENSMEGEWDMEAGVLFKVGEFHSQLISGKWKMEKVK